jgi:hypothetical protein
MATNKNINRILARAAKTGYVKCLSIEIFGVVHSFV